MTGQGFIVTSALWRRRWVIVSAAVLAGLGGYALSSLQPPTYTAGSRLILGVTQNFDPLGDDRSSTSPTRYVANQLSIIESQPVLRQAVDRLGFEPSVSDLSAVIDVSAPADSDVIDVTASAPTAEEAAAVANAVVASYQEFVRAQTEGDAESAAAMWAGNVGAVAEIRARASAYGDGLAVIEGASPSGSPTSPKPRRDGLLAAMLAALVASGVALWRRDRGTPESAVGLAAEVGAPLLGIVPMAPGRKGVLPSQASSDMTLVALDYVVPGGLAPIMVTSLDRRSGVPDLVMGLAAAAGRQRRVVIVAADADGPSMTGWTGAAPPDTRLEDFRDGGDVSRLTTPLTLVHGGEDVTVHLAVLGRTGLGHQGDGSAVRRGLRLLSESHDLVLVAAGPLPSDPSAFALLRDVGAVVLAVGRAERPDSSRLPALRRQLELAGRVCDGVVVTVRTRSVRDPQDLPRSRPAAATPDVTAEDEVPAGR